jgi:hypothetical protein
LAFLFIKNEKNAEMTFFHKIVKKHRFGVFIHKKMKKNAKTAFFHKIK